MSEEPYDAVTARIAATTTAHALGRAEADALLWLAKTVADASGDRRTAPPSPAPCSGPSRKTARSTTRPCRPR